MDYLVRVRGIPALMTRFDISDETDVVAEITAAFLELAANTPSVDSSNLEIVVLLQKLTTIKQLKFLFLLKLVKEYLSV